MAMLPRYERLGVKAAQPAQLDFANFREQSQAAQTLSQSLGRMSDFAFGVAEKKFEQVAKQTVSNLGATETLARIQKAGGPTSSFDMVAFQTANRIASAEIQMQSDKDINGLLETAQKTGMSIADVSTHLADITDGYAATLSTLDPEAAGLLRVRIGEASGQAIQRYGSYVESQAKAARSARIEAAGDLYAANMMQTALIPGITPETLYTMAQNRKNLLIDAGVKPERAEAWAATALKSAVKENISFSAMTMNLTDLGTMVNTVPTEALPGMEYTETVSLWNTAKTAYNVRTESVRIEAQQLNKDIQTENQLIGSGGMTSPKRLADLKDRATISGDPELIRQVTDLEGSMTYVSGLNGKNIAELDLEIASIQGGVPGIGEIGLDTPKELEMLAFARKARDAAQSALSITQAEDKAAAAPMIAELGAAVEVMSQQLDLSNPDPAAIDYAFQKMLAIKAKFPEGQLTDELKSKIAEITLIAGDFKTFREALPSETQAKITRLTTETPKGSPLGMDPIFTIAMNGRRAKLLTTLQAAQSDALAKGDALSYAKAKGMQLTDNQGNVHLAGEPLNFTNVETVSESLNRRINDVIRLENRFGAPGSSQNIFLPEEKAQLVNILKSGDLGLAAMTLDAIASMGGAVTEKALAEIGAEDPVFAHVGGIFADGRSTNNAALIETGQSILRGLRLEKPIALSGNDPKDAATDYFGGALYFLPTFAKGATQAADAMYADFAAQNPEAAKSFDAEIYNTFLDKALGTMEISTEFDKAALVPRGLTSSWIENLQMYGSPPSRTKTSFTKANPNYAEEFFTKFVANQDELVDFPTSALPDLEWYPFLAGQKDGKSVWTLRHTAGGISQDWADKNGTRIYLDLNAMAGVSQ